MIFVQKMLIVWLDKTLIPRLKLYFGRSGHWPSFKSTIWRKILERLLDVHLTLFKCSLNVLKPIMITKPWTVPFTFT